MKISISTINLLTKIITGDPVVKEDEYSNLRKYKTGQDIVDFFNYFGIDDIYITGARNEYTKNNLRALNGKTEIKSILEEVVSPVYETAENPIIEVVKSLDKTLRQDGYKFVEKEEVVEGYYYGSQFIPPCTIKHYKIKQISQNNLSIETKNIDALSHEFINQQIEKAKNKLEQEDYDGVITNIRSMIEAVQETLIIKNGLSISEHKGDLDKIYKSTKKCLNLDTNKDLDEVLKQILSGLNSINCGIAGLSNKASDRHSRKYKPAKHHAKLAINCGLSFCEFLLDSYKYQKTKDSQ
ncbi:MAG: hypothetical protein ACJAZX_000979 [Rickettsiales bacterium]|jgi:hypothetical protein